MCIRDSVSTNFNDYKQAEASIKRLNNINLEPTEDDKKNLARISNIEGNIVSKIQESSNYDYIVINPAAFTHTSIAIRDALLSINAKFIEVHLSNIYSREDFRQNSYISSIAIGVISGFGFHGYILALEYLSSLKDQ